MKKFDVGKGIHLLANLGVIVGIAFLAFELNQNNKLLRAEAEYNYLQARLTTRQRMVFDSDFAEFIERVESGDPLSAVDQRRVNASIEATFLGKQWEFGQFLDGNLSVNRNGLIARWRSEFHDQTSDAKALERSIWSSFRASLNADFVRFMDEEVFAE